MQSTHFISSFQANTIDPESKGNESGTMAEIDHLEMQKQSMSTTEPGTAFNPSMAKRLNLKAAAFSSLRAAILDVIYSSGKPPFSGTEKY